MGVKAKMEAPPKDGVSIDVFGLADCLQAVAGAENLICKYERFAEHVMLSCAMPEVPRFTLADDDDDSMIGQTCDVLYGLLVRYRRMTEWFRNNGIDVESVVGNNTGKAKS